MTLVVIMVATLASGIGSVWVASLLMRAGLGKHQADAGPRHLLSLAAGALLATAFMHLLPEAFESEASAHELFAILLVGVVFFFLLDKAELWHHGHEHQHGETQKEGGEHHHDHAHGHDHSHAHGHHHGHAHSPTAGGWSLITGDSVHCFGDGVLIASAFLADWRLGWVAAVSVLAHEVPHHIGDLVVLGHQHRSERQLALLKVSLAGAVTMLGGVTGYLLIGRLEYTLPYFLALASSSFVYVALADLIPQLQKRLSAKETVLQVLSLLTGIVLVTLVSGLAHSH